jgi:hypothetical protein
MAELRDTLLARRILRTGRLRPDIQPDTVMFTKRLERFPDDVLNTWDKAHELALLLSDADLPRPSWLPADVAQACLHFTRDERVYIAQQLSAFNPDGTVVYISEGQPQHCYAPGPTGLPESIVKPAYVAGSRSARGASSAPKAQCQCRHAVRSARVRMTQRRQRH